MVWNAAHAHERPRSLMSVYTKTKSPSGSSNKAASECIFYVPVSALFIALVGLRPSHVLLRFALNVATAPEWCRFRQAHNLAPALQQMQ